ncbi:MAG: peroxiredoxin [Bryobacterales bacterium]|nr:peroxiredoxin [Bryobacterales bacterium]
MELPRVGEPAPDFSGPTEDGTLRLSDLRGQRVVLYFYPRNHTPVCTAEACAFRDALAEFSAENCAVVGVSTNTVESHRRFRSRHSLPFRLVSDRDQAIAKAYGVWREKLLFGRKFWGTVRSTFVIDEGGRIHAVFDRVRVAGHAKQVLASLRGARPV